MKKLIIAAALMMSAVAAQAEVEWSWWLEDPSAKAELAFGIASRIDTVDTFEFTALYSGSTVKNGVQWSFFGINDSDSDCGLQLSWWFNRGENPCAQVGCINIDKTSVFDLGFLNFSDDAKVQIGFLNFNKNGFLPVFPFINLSMTLFE